LIQSLNSPWLVDWRKFLKVYPESYPQFLCVTCGTQWRQNPTRNRTIIVKYSRRPKTMAKDKSTRRRAYRPTNQSMIPGYKKVFLRLLWNRNKERYAKAIKMLATMAKGSIDKAIRLCR